jgi:hypothetical protein
MTCKTKEYKGASVQVASFVKEGGCCEYHMMVHTLAAGSFEQQLEALHEAFDDAMEDVCRGVHPVFVRYFLSDISNQAETLKNILDKRQSCAVSVIGQPPLDGSKVLFSVLDSRRYYQLMRYERYGMILLLLLLSTGVLRNPLSDAVVWMFDRLFSIAELGFEIVRKIVM